MSHSIKHSKKNVTEKRFASCDEVYLFIAEHLNPEGRLVDGINVFLDIPVTVKNCIRPKVVTKRCYLFKIANRNWTGTMDDAWKNDNTPLPFCSLDYNYFLHLTENNYKYAVAVIPNK